MWAQEGILWLLNLNTIKVNLSAGFSAWLLSLFLPSVSCLRSFCVNDGDLPPATSVALQKTLSWWMLCLVAVLVAVISLSMCGFLFRPCVMHVPAFSTFVCKVCHPDGRLLQLLLLRCGQTILLFLCGSRSRCLLQLLSRPWSAARSQIKPGSSLPKTITGAGLLSLCVVPLPLTWLPQQDCGG